VISPARLLARVRRWVLFLAVAGALYGYSRFDVVLLPEGALSPVFGIHPGQRFLVDRHARSGGPGETWLYRGPDGALLLGRALEPPEGLDAEARAALAEGALWLCFERPVPGLADSRTLGPIPTSALEGRVILVLPW